MRRVAQRYYEHGDCGIACAAMVSGRAYSEAHDAAIELGLKTADGYYYTYHHNLKNLLTKLGCKTITRKRFMALREVIPPAIVKVNLRDHGRYWHWVVVFKDKEGNMVLLDPKPGKSSRIVSFRGYKGAGHYLHVAQPGAKAGLPQKRGIPLAQRSA